MKDEMKPKDHAEAVALFRMGVIGPLTVQDLTRGELTTRLRELAEQRFRLPGSDITRRFQFSTLERWYYAYRKLGLDGLMTRPRSDRGHGKELTDEARELLLDIGRERPEVPISVVMRTLIADGRLKAEDVSRQTVQRLFADHGLSRAERKEQVKGRRRRWQAAAPDDLWHADVCHGPSLEPPGKPKIPLRVHAILDDASRYVIAIRAYSTEREADMLELLVQSLRVCGPPKTLYLDNGSTYRGDALSVGCGRLGVQLVHARPYDPQSRGKMERFWRTLRQGCLDYLGSCTSLYDVQVRLLAFIQQHYHRAPHGGLVGRSPGQVYVASRSHDRAASEEDLRTALTVRGNRRVRKDGTVPVGGVDWELEAGFLAGKTVTVARTLYDPRAAPWVEKDGVVYPLKLVNPVANGLERREKKPRRKAKTGIDAFDFDPTRVLLDRLLGRPAKHPSPQKRDRKEGDA
jgi:transposase InsO family protein